MPPIDHHSQAAAMKAWLATPAGRRLLLDAQTQWTGESIIAGGQVLLKLLPEQDWPVAAIGDRFTASISLAMADGHWTGPFRAAPSSWPLQSASVSRIEAHFVLESASDRESLLAECARVLCPEGRLLVLGINPYSALRLRWHRHGLRAMPRQAAISAMKTAGLEILCSQYLGSCWSVPATSALPSDPALFQFGKVAWGVLGIRREWPLTLLRWPKVRREVSFGVPAA